MKISFSWEHLDGSASPICQSTIVNEDGVDLLSCILMNDGGLGYAESVAWLSEGIERISSVKSGKFIMLDWDREDWGAKFDASNVVIYSMYDNDYAMSLSLEIFERALLHWRDFLAKGPQHAAKVSLEI